ncbi:hypothetical protein MTO96_002985 [Rhipicephalus appendiculatus]
MSPWTLGPSQALTGPKGRRLVRRVVRKRRRTTLLAGNASTEFPVSRLGSTAVVADGSLEDRKLDEAQEPGKLSRKLLRHLAPQKADGRSDVSALSSEATVGLPTNETCDSSSRCRVPSYNEGIGPQNGLKNPGIFQHSSELTGDVTSPNAIHGSVWTKGELTETTVTHSIAPGLLDWLFARGVNNGLSGKESAAKKDGIFRYKTDPSANPETKSSDNWQEQSSRVSITGTGFSTAAESHKPTSKDSKNRSSAFPDHINGVEKATTLSSHQMVTDSAPRAETFRKLLGRDNVTSLISTSSPSQTTLEASSGRYRVIGTDKGVEGNASLSYVPQNVSSVTADKEMHSNGNRFSGSVDEPFTFSPEGDIGGRRAGSGAKASSLDLRDEWTTTTEPERLSLQSTRTLAPGGHSASVTGGVKKEAQRNVGGATRSQEVDVSSEYGGLKRDTVRGAAGSGRNGRLDQPAVRDIPGRSTELEQTTIEANVTDVAKAVSSRSSGSHELHMTSSVEERVGSSTKRSRIGDAEANTSGNSVQTATSKGYTPSLEHTQEAPRLINSAESHNFSEPTEVGPTENLPRNAEYVSASSRDQRGAAISNPTSSIRTSPTMNLSSITPLSHLGVIRNVSVVSGAPKTELSKTPTTRASTRRRLKLETTQHNTAPEVLELTSPTGTISSKAQGHTLPNKLHIMCSIGATYPGPYPVRLCDKIMIKDAVTFDQVRIKFTVRSYDAFLALKAQQVQRGSFKIVGLMTWRNIEQFRLLNPSSDAFVEKVERLLLRINLDGLCMDLAGVTRGNIMAYRHILRDMRVRLMDTKFLCSLFDYNVLYKASFQDLLSLLRVFNTTVIHQSVQSISNMETSVPNALRHLTRRKYSLTAALELAMEIRGTSRHRGVCWTLTPWGMEYRLLLPTEATGVGVLARFVRSAVSGSDLCTTYQKLPRAFDNMTATWYFVNDTKWIAYDDRNSLEQKIPQLLAAYAPDCVFVEDVQRDDARGVCDRPFPLVSSLQGMLAEALKYTTHVAASSTTASSLAL